jgi:hypothetical protein
MVFTSSSLRISAIVRHCLFQSQAHTLNYVILDDSALWSLMSLIRHGEFVAALQKEKHVWV